jgi:hypothetical protein
MSTFSPRDLLNASRWSKLFFTTYALSLSFFEAVVLDAMFRQRIDEALIVADESGIRSAMNELGAQAVGRAYDLEPVAVKGGCFHAKFASVISKSDAHLLIGSGNLTFGGWGSNAECIEHLHPSFAADAFLDAANFLEALANSPRIRHAISVPCLELAGDLAGRVTGRARDGQIRLVHNVGRSISEQISEFARDLGGAVSLVVVSPFFDHDGLSNLCLKLGLDFVRVHVHEEGTVLGSAGSNWPSGRSEAITEAVNLEMFQPEHRLLHAKLYEILCKRGRIVISGSSNATYAGLEVDRNVELCVVRLQREKSVGWRFTAAKPPVRHLPAEDETGSNSKEFAVLRAVLTGSRITGKIVSNFPSGAVSVSKKTALRWEPMGSAFVSAAGDFALEFSDGWNLVSGGQFLIRLEHISGKKAQGFVSLPELRDIARRLGAPSSHFFSLLQNKETPADVVAILDFIYMHPDWLPKRDFSGGASRSAENRADITVDLDNLLSTAQSWNHGPQSDSANWSNQARFMNQVFAALSERRGPMDGRSTNQETDEGGESDAHIRNDVDKAERETTQALASFERLFSVLLDGAPENRQPFRAAQITQYVAERLEVDSVTVSAYLDRLVRSFTKLNVADEELTFVEALLLLWSSQLQGNEESRAMALRRQVLRVVGTIRSCLPPLELVGGLADRLKATADLHSLWNYSRGLETVQEEIRRFWKETSNTLQQADYPLLGALPEWKILQYGKSKGILPVKVASGYCPGCNLALSSVDANRMKSFGVVTCRGKILLCEEF